MNDIQERLLFTYAIICMMIITFVSADYIFNTIIDIIGASITIAATILIAFVVLFKMSGDD